MKSRVVEASELWRGGKHLARLTLEVELGGDLTFEKLLELERGADAPELPPDPDPEV